MADDLDDLLSDALDDLKVPEKKGTETSKSSTTKNQSNATDRAAIIEKAKLKKIKYNPAKWQETLSFLSAEEKTKWARGITIDIVAQSRMSNQPSYSNAYRNGIISDSKSNAGIAAFLDAGADAIKPYDEKSLLKWCIRKSLEKSGKQMPPDFEPSETLQKKYHELLCHLVDQRAKHFPDEKENISQQLDRFPTLAKLYGIK